MVSSAKDYEYVTVDEKTVDKDHPLGDLDRIIIDGKIMPLRTGFTGNVDANGNPIPRANILRGEDIAFLMEFANQRRFAITRAAEWYNANEEHSVEWSRSVEKSEFSRVLGYTFPYYNFLYIALDTGGTKSSGVDQIFRFFDDELDKKGFVGPLKCDSRVWISNQVIGWLEDPYGYGGTSFSMDKSGDRPALTPADIGTSLQRDQVEAYFNAAEGVTDKGWGGFPIKSALVFGRSDCYFAIKQWEDSDDSTFDTSTVFPDFGRHEEDQEEKYYSDDEAYDNKTPSRTTYLHHHYHGYPNPEVVPTLYSVDAPHGDHAVAVCFFLVQVHGFSFHKVTRDGGFTVVSKAFPMEREKEGSQTFVLKSAHFASDKFVDAVIEASGLSFPADITVETPKTQRSFMHRHVASISIEAIVPVVYFDDHTRW